MTNHKDFTESRKGKWKKRVYLASKNAYDTFNGKVEGSWENPKTKMKAMVTIYGPTSYWGKIEEEERRGLEALEQMSVCTEVPVRTPLEYAKAVYDANRITLMVPTAVHDALVQEANTKEIVYLLQKTRATVVLQRALRAYQKRSWERKFVKIDPQLDKLVKEERTIENSIYEDAAKKQLNTNGGMGGTFVAASPIPGPTTSSSLEGVGAGAGEGEGAGAGAGGHTEMKVRGSRKSEAMSDDDDDDNDGRLKGVDCEECHKPSDKTTRFAPCHRRAT